MEDNYKSCNNFEEIKGLAERITGDMHYCYVHGYLNKRGELKYRTNDAIAEICLFSNSIEEFKSVYLETLKHLEATDTELYKRLKTGYDKCFKDFKETFEEEIEAEDNKKEEEI